MWSGLVVCLILLVFTFVLSLQYLVNLDVFSEFQRYKPAHPPLSKSSVAIPHNVFKFVISPSNSTNDKGVRLYNFLAAYNYIDEKCPAALTAYKESRSIDVKAELFGHCALFTEGGLFMGEFVRLVQHFSKVIQADAHGLLLVHDKGHVWPGMMGAAWPGHPFYLCALRELTDSGANYLDKCARHYFYRYNLIDKNGGKEVQNKTHVVAASRAGWFPIFEI